MISRTKAVITISINEYKCSYKQKTKEKFKQEKTTFYKTKEKLIRQKNNILYSRFILFHTTVQNIGLIVC